MWKITRNWVIMEHMDQTLNLRSNNTYLVSHSEIQGEVSFQYWLSFIMSWLNGLGKPQQTDAAIMLYVRGPIVVRLVISDLSSHVLFFI